MKSDRKDVKKKCVFDVKNGLKTPLAICPTISSSERVFRVILMSYVTPPE